MKHGALVLVATALVVSACTSVDPSATTTSQAPTPPVPPTTSGTPGSPTSQSDEELCGAEFPLFVAELDENDPADINGTPGPGPGSQPAAPGQMVTHWLGEYGNYELRWPPTEPQPDTVDWTSEAAGRPAAAVGVGRSRVTLYVQLDDTGNRCSRIAAEVYGPRTEPLGDSIVLFMEALRDRGGAEAHLSALAAQDAPSTEGAEYPEGRCGVPILVDSEVSPGDALVLVENFLADRADGRRAQSCLTGSGLASYQESDQFSWPSLCLFECQDGAVFDTVKVAPYEWGQEEGVQDVAAVISFSEGGEVRSVLEIYRVISVSLPSGETVAAIFTVLSREQIEIDEGATLAFVSDLLRRLAEGHYEIAGILVIGEGVTAEIKERLPNVWEVDDATLLEEFCGRAMCSAQSQIIGALPTRRFSRDIIVEFEGKNGTVTKRISVGTFHGFMTVGGLPPAGESGAHAVPLVESVFRGRPHSGIAVVGERSLELWGSAAPTDPMVFYSATGVVDLVAVGEWIVANSSWSETLWASVEPVTQGEFTTIEAVRNPWGESPTLVGGGAIADVPYAFVVDGGDLLAINLGSSADRALLDTDGDDSIVVGASMAGGTLAVTRQSGDTVSYEMYDVQLADSKLEVSRRRDLSASRASGPMALATDGSAAAYVTVGSDQLPSAVAVVDTNGAQVGSWQGPEGWYITRLTFDGRWILATLESPSVTRLSRSDRILVIDTLEDEQWVVNTFARFAFNY